MYIRIVPPGFKEAALFRRSLVGLVQIFGQNLSVIVKNKRLLPHRSQKDLEIGPLFGIREGDGSESIIKNLIEILDEKLIEIQN